MFIIICQSDVMRNVQGKQFMMKYDFIKFQYTMVQFKQVPVPVPVPISVPVLVPKNNFGRCRCRCREKKMRHRNTDRNRSKMRILKVGYFFYFLPQKTFDDSHTIQLRARFV